jgi:non-homologous end joining protein Ku
MEVIDAKMKGQKIEAPSVKRDRPSNVVDLMSRLQESLERAQGPGHRAKGRKGERDKVKGTGKRAKASKGSKKRAKVA